MMVRKSPLILLLFFYMAGSVLWAHEKTPSYLKVSAKGNSVRVSFKCPLDRQGNKAVSITYPGSWRMLSRKVSVINDMGIEDMVFESDELKGRCLIRRQGFNDSPVIVTLIENDVKSTHILNSDIRDFKLENFSGGNVSILKNFTLLGVEHILLGIDHLLFVLALLFLVKGKQLIGAVTSFTLAHSITLIISTLKIIAIPSTVVEALIAFSIVLMAVEVFKPAILHNSRNYVAMAFFFGLLHGFGFAGVLSELGLPEGNLLLALFSFNVGVEVGQLVFIGAVLILMPFMERLIERDTIVKTCSYVIGSVGAFWFLDRTLGVWLM